MFNRNSAIPLKDSKQDTILIIIISLMICSILVIESSALFLSKLGNQWHHSVSDIATIEAPKSTTTRTLNELKKLLDKSYLIKDYKEISIEDMKHALSPWMNDTTLDNTDLPLPHLFTLSLRSDDPIERDKLKFAIKALDDKIKLETQQNWLNVAFERAKSLTFMAWFIGSTLSITLIVSLAILTRTRILLNHDIIQLLHSSGASDNYIIKQFLFYIGGITFKGIIFGGALTALLLFFMMPYTTTQQGAMQSHSISLSDLNILWATPIVIFMCIMILTSQTILSALRKMI